MKHLRRIRSFITENRYPLFLFLASRIGLFLCVYAGLVLIPVRDGEGLWRAISDNLFLDGLVRWDSGYYISIANNGYLHSGTARDTAFFPAYPLLLSWAKAFGDRWLISWGVSLSNLFFCCGLCFCFQLTKAIRNEKTARMTVALLAFAPFSIFFSSVYTESLFFAATVASFWLARKGLLYLAMGAAAIAAATRVAGFFCIPFVYAYYRSTAQSGTSRHSSNTICESKNTIQPMLALLTGFSLTAIHLIHLRIRFGSFLTFFQSQKDWSASVSSQELMGAWKPVLGLQVNQIMAGELGLMHIINSSSLALAVIAIVIGLAKRLLPQPILLWSLFTVIASFSAWSSGLRYVSALFPITILFAIACRQLPAEIIIALSAMAMALFALAFSHWYWVA